MWHGCRTRGVRESYAALLYACMPRCMHALSARGRRQVNWLLQFLMFIVCISALKVTTMAASESAIAVPEVHPLVEEVLLSPDEIAARVKEVGRSVARDYAQKQPIIVVVRLYCDRVRIP